MKLPIIFQAIERIEGKEGKSKLLHNESELYALLHRIKKRLNETYTVGSDRMDLHIELTKERRDPEFSTKAASLQNQILDLSNPENWGYLGRAFVLWTPKVEAYGETHITVAFFGRHPKPATEELRKLILSEFIEA